MNIEIGPNQKVERVKRTLSREWSVQLQEREEIESDEQRRGEGLQERQQEEERIEKEI